MKNVHGKISRLAVLQGQSILNTGQAIILCLFLVSLVCAESLTLPLDQRPDWLQQDGIVMAGSWEPLLFRVRRDGSAGYIPTAKQRADYLHEHSPEMVAQLKDLGVNFVMMHCYKGAGLQAEQESMADAVKFAQLCREVGLHVGVYNYSGAFIWELFFKEVPEAKNWLLLDKNGKPLRYGRADYRYYWNRNHPDAQAFYQQLIRFAVKDIRADLLHFDNYSHGPGSDTVSAKRFRQYLAEKFPPKRLKEMGVCDLNSVQPPITASQGASLRLAWLDFSCQSLADSYCDMGRYARQLRKDILIECNPGGVRERIRAPLDLGRLLQGGEAFWDESSAPGYRDKRLQTRIRTFKVARRMNNAAFHYTTTPLEAAETMAFNLDSLGCICWFEYGRLVARPGAKKGVTEKLEPFIRFFHNRRDLLRQANVIADVAVLRSFASQVFADSRYAKLAYGVEQSLIENRACFQIIHNEHLNELKPYRVLVLAGCVALSDYQIEIISRYVKSGGRLCIVGPVGTHDEWMVAREKPVFDDMPASRVVHIAADGDILKAIRQVCGDELSLSVKAMAGLCSEVTEQPGRRLVHLVNYRSNAPIKNIVICLRVPNGHNVKAVMAVSPEREQSLDLSFREHSGIVTFTVPEVNVYEIAVVTIR